MDGLGLYVRSSLLIDKTTFGQASLHCFSETKDCRVIIPENWVSKLNSGTGLGLYVGSSLLIDKTTLGQASLHRFSETKDCRVVIPENWVSKLNSGTGLGLYVGSSHPKTLSEMTKPPHIDSLIFDVIVDCAALQLKWSYQDTL